MPEAKYKRGSVSVPVTVTFIEPTIDEAVTDCVGLIPSQDLFQFYKNFPDKSPVIGDRVEVGVDVYEVAEPAPGFSCWGFSKPDNAETRVHLAKVE